MGSGLGQGGAYDLSFKILLIGDSGVGKSSLLVSFISASPEIIAPTIGDLIRAFVMVVLMRRASLEH